VEPSLKRGRGTADRPSVMEQRPLPEALPATETTEPKLEVVPEPAEVDAVDVVETEPTEPQTADPLKLYVRQIGDGPLLTPAL